jgi:Thioredoxin-like [2Fe-2S] ferredoxin
VADRRDPHAPDGAAAGRPDRGAPRRAEAFGYLDPDALEFIGGALGVPLSKVYGVATFYSFFTLKPHGQHTCVVCTGTACYINGAPRILAEIRGRLGVGPRETTEDDKLSVLTARCLGAMPDPAGFEWANYVRTLASWSSRATVSPGQAALHDPEP